VAKYLGRSGGPPSQSWRTILTNHVSQLASIDFFTVPTATFRVLFVFVVLSHPRRRIVHLNVTAHPTAAWTAQQLREAWPWDTAPRFVIHDRDRIYGVDPRRTAIIHGNAISLLGFSSCVMATLTARHQRLLTVRSKFLIGTMCACSVENMISTGKRI